jgi:FtsH-binding integral membrane protein
MSQADNPYRTWGLTAAEAPTSERANFIRKTYLHLAGAVLAFMAIEYALLNTPGVGDAVAMVLNNRWGWLVVLGGFMGVSYIANAWAASGTSPAMQYLGLTLYVVAEAVIFVPLLYVAQSFGEQSGVDIITTAGALTALVFVGLTAIVFVSGADFSFLRTALLLGGWVAMGVILVSILFGFNLGILFTAAVLLLAGGYILYDTSNVLHHYRIGQHVAAALALFAAVALMFWYMVQLVMSLNRR